MPEDDDEDCRPHMWRMTGGTIGLDGAHVDEQCDLCGAVRFYKPNVMPLPDEAGWSPRQSTHTDGRDTG